MNRSGRIDDLVLSARNCYAGEPRFSSALHLEKELAVLGCKVERFGEKTVIAQFGYETCVFVETVTSFTSFLAVRFVKDKVKAKRFLKAAGVTVAKGAAFGKEQKALARQKVLELHGRAIVKPSDGRKGRGVTIGVTEENFDAAWDAACRETERRILVEEAFLGGVEARYFVVDGNCVAVSMRIPPTIVGDGERTIAQLVEMENQLRRENPNLGHRPIILDEGRLFGLKKRGFETSSILGKGERLVIDSKANVSTGAATANVTELVHPGMMQFAERAANAFPGLDVAGIDVLALDHTAAPSPAGYIVVEVNTRPGIGGHHFPAYGQPVNVARHIAEYCVNRMKANGASRMQHPAVRSKPR